MNLRKRAAPQHPGIQLAPLVDVLLLLLIFFLLTFNAARSENELDVKVPIGGSSITRTAFSRESFLTSPFRSTKSFSGSIPARPAGRAHIFISANVIGR